MVKRISALSDGRPVGPPPGKTSADTFSAANKIPSPGRMRGSNANPICDHRDHHDHPDDTPKNSNISSSSQII